MIRPIQTREEIERKKKRNMLILSILMLSILVLSTLGFAFFTAPASQPKNNENIEQTPIRLPTDKISVQYQGSQIQLLSTYNDIENISVNITITPESYSGKVLYLDIENQGILREVASSIGKFSSRLQEACYGTCERNLPEKNCTALDNLIVWNESQQNTVYQQNNCVFIEGDMRSADAFLYELFLQEDL